jgi:hypothetical protein
VNGDSSSSLSAQPHCSTSISSSSTVLGSPYTTSCSSASDPNYTISYVGGSVTLTPAPLTVTASGGSFTYGSSPPSITAVYSGFFNSETPASLTKQASCSTTATSTSPVASYDSSCSGVASSNYSISYVSGAVVVKAATPSVSAIGQSGQSTGPVTISVKVAGPSDVEVPTGSVTVSDGVNNCTISALDTSGSGSCQLIENASEDGKTVTASYSPTDANYTAASGTTTESVGLGVPSLSVSGPSSAVTGWITYEVTVTGQGASPTGKVTISDQTKTCTGTINVQGVGACSLQETTGVYEVSAQYTGDGNYNLGSASSNEIVNETATSLAVSTTTLVYGREQVASFSVTVTPPPGVTPPTGTTVTVMAGKNTLCVTSPLVPTSVIDPTTGLSYTVAGGSCTLSPGAVGAGSYTVTAEFPGVTGSLVGSTSNPATLTIERAPTSTSLSLSSATTTYGTEKNELLMTKVAVPAGSFYVTGQVSLKSGSKELCVTTLKDGFATCRLSRLEFSAGLHVIVADYRGSTSLISSSSRMVTLVVAKAPTAAVLSLSQKSLKYHSEHAESFSARVGVGAGVPYATGTVVVMTGTQKLCRITLVHGKGSCSLTASELKVGSYPISLHYAGSSDLRASSSRAEMLVVSKAS